MTRRFLLLPFLFAVAFPAYGQCRIDRFTEIRGYPLEIEIAGDRAWVADGAGLTGVDIADPFDPQIAHSTFEQTPSIDLEIVSESEIALLTQDRLIIYDVSGEAPVQISDVAASGRSVHLLGDRLVVVGDRLSAFGMGEDGLVESSSVDLGGEVVSSAADGDLLLVSVSGIGTIVYDEVLDRRGRVSVTAESIVIDRRIAYLGRGDAVFSVDLTNPDLPEILANLGSLSGEELMIHGNELFASDGLESVAVIDVTRADEPTLIHTVDAPIAVMASDGEHLYGYGFERDRFGTRFEDGPYLGVRDLDSPGLELVGSVGHSTGPLRDVATDGETAWLADAPLVRAIDLHTGEELWSLELEERFDRIRYENGLLILYGATWVHLVEPSGHLLGTWPTMGTPGGGVTFSGPWLIEVNRSSGFHVLDVTDPSHIIQRGGLINDGRGQWMEAVGIPGAVYGIVNTGIKVVSLGSDPSAVSIVDFLTFGKPIDVEIATIDGRKYLLVLDGRNLHVHDLVNPLHPVEIGVVDVGPGQKMSVWGHIVAVLGQDGLVTRVDLTEPDSPQVLEVIDGMREGLAIAAAGDVLVGADRWALWAVPLTPAEESAPPMLDLIGEDSNIAQLGWTGRAVYQTQIQIATDAGFQNVTKDLSIWGENFVLEKSSNAQWARARFLTGCVASEWSDVVMIDAKRTRGRVVRRP